MFAEGSVRLFIAAIAFSVAAIGALVLQLTLQKPPPAPAIAAALRQQLEAAVQTTPIQTATSRQPFDQGKFRIIPRAEYDITARVFSTHRYHWNMADDFYEISPEDIAVGWGKLSDYALKGILHIRQEDRFFKYRWQGQPPFPPALMQYSMANNHIVPASDEIARQLKQVRAGSIVHMTGALIDIAEPGTATIHTSLTRTDAGPGACEIIWLETLQIAP